MKPERSPMPDMAEGAAAFLEKRAGPRFPAVARSPRNGAGERRDAVNTPIKLPGRAERTRRGVPEESVVSAKTSGVAWRHRRASGRVAAVLLVGVSKGDRIGFLLPLGKNSSFVSPARRSVRSFVPLNIYLRGGFSNIN